MVSPNQAQIKAKTGSRSPQTSPERPSLLQRHGWPAWLALLVVIILLIELILVCGSASLFNLIAPFSADLTQRVDSAPGSAAAQSVAFSPDGRLLAAAWADGTIRLWQLDEDRKADTLVTEAGRLTQLAFSPHGQYLAAGSWEGLVRVWSVGDGHLQATFRHPAAVGRIAFSPDGRSLASGDWRGTVWLWQLADSRVATAWPAHTDWINGLAFTPDGQHLFSSANDGTVRRHNLADKTDDTLLTARIGPPAALALAPDGTTLAVARFETEIVLLDPEDGVPQQRIATAAPCWSLAFSDDGSYLAAGTDGAVLIWSVTAGRLVAELPTDDVSALSVAYAPGGAWLAAALRDGRVLRWPLANGTPGEPIELPY